MNEYISREAVNDLIEDIRNNHFILMSDRITLVLLKSKVAEIPAADVQPVVHGKWDTHDVVKVLCSGKTLDGFCQCEACGDVFPLAYSEYNYCPNCGARMDGEQDD